MRKLEIIVFVRKLTFNLPFQRHVVGFSSLRFQHIFKLLLNVLAVIASFVASAVLIVACAVDWHSYPRSIGTLCDRWSCAVMLKYAGKILSHHPMTH